MLKEFIKWQKHAKNTLNIRRSFLKRFDAKTLTTCRRIRRPRYCWSDSVDPITSFNRGISCQKVIERILCFWKTSCTSNKQRDSELNKQIVKHSMFLYLPRSSREDSQSAICYQWELLFGWQFVESVLWMIEIVITLLCLFSRYRRLHCNKNRHSIYNLYFIIC